LAINHVLACAWYAIALLGSTLPGDTWVQFYGFHDEPWINRYCVALHWSITQFTPSSMMVNPQNIAERTFNITVVVFALVGFSYIVGSISGSLAQLRSLQEDASKQFWTLRRWLRQNGVAKQLSVRIQKYLEHTWHAQQEKIPKSKVKLFSLLSEQLHNELLCAVSVPHVSVHPLFQYLHKESSETMFRLAKTAFSRMSVARHDSVFFPSEVAQYMYFVVDGVLDYLRVDHEGTAHKERVDSNEDWIAEPVLWTSLWIHRGVLVASTECDLLLIDPDSFLQTVSLSPDTFKMACVYSKNYLEWLNDLDKRILSDVCQGEDESWRVQSFIASAAQSDGTASARIRKRLQRMPSWLG